MKRNPNATCKNCIYWDIKNIELPSRYGIVDPSGISKSKCRFEAPRTTPPQNDLQSKSHRIFPKTKENEWCGKHPDFLIKE